jgi:hypothetical protein
MMPKSIVLVAILFAVAVLPASAQTSDPESKATLTPLTWDVVSIKPHKALDATSSMELHADGIEFHNMTLHGLFLNAFEVRSESQIVGYPAWVNSEHFDIRPRWMPKQQGHIAI